MEDKVTKLAIAENTANTKDNLYAKLMRMRVSLQNSGIQMSGFNQHKNFKYYELDDFLPQINKLSQEQNVIFLYQLGKEQAVLSMVSCDSPEERLEFCLPLADVSIAGANGIQNIGGLATYTRRYLYMIAFEISENDPFDPDENNAPKLQNKQEKPTPEQQKQIDNIALQKIPQAKLNIIQKELTRTGVSVDAICDRYNLNDLTEITEGLFSRVMEALKATKTLNQ